MDHGVYPVQLCHFIYVLVVMPYFCLSLCFREPEISMCTSLNQIRTYRTHEETLSISTNYDWTQLCLT